MRIWHQRLIPKLCTKHLLAQWREGLGCYSIIFNNKKGYSKHPQVIQYKNSLQTLWYILETTRNEMLKRGFNPKPLPGFPSNEHNKLKTLVWQTLKQQKEILRNKNCNCKV